MSQERILTIPALGGIGDLAFCRGAFFAVRRRFPESHINTAASKATKPLMEPGFCDGIWEVKLKEILGQGFLSKWAAPLKAIAFVTYLHREDISKVINISGRSFPRTILNHLFPNLEIINPKGISRRNDIHVSEEILGCVQIGLGSKDRPLPPKPEFPFSPEEKSQLERLKEQIEPQRAIILLMDSTDHNKDWPFSYWTQLGRSLVRSGFKIFVSCLSRPEVEEKIVRQIPNAYRLPYLPTPMAISLLSEFALAVSLDSGIGHYLSLKGTPIIMLYGPSLAKRFGPLGNSNHSITIEGKKDKNCQFRYGYCETLPLNIRDLFNPATCMSLISHEEVTDTAFILLAKNSSGNLRRHLINYPLRNR